jgi:hypothetical protein
MHIHVKAGNVQFAATVTWATTKAEKKSKDANGAATGRIGRESEGHFLSFATRGSKGNVA